MSLTPLYLSEIASPQQKAVMGTVFPFGLTLGILISQILGLPFILGKQNPIEMIEISQNISTLGTDKSWALLVGGQSIYASFSLLLHPWLPESSVQNIDHSGW